MNTVIFVGRLVADPVLRHSKSNTPIASFSLAIERTFKQEGQPDVDFFDASAFGNTASYLSQYAVKGSLIEAVGRIEIDHFNSREGEKRTAVRFKIDRAKILASPKARTTTAGTESIYMIQTILILVISGTKHQCLVI